MATPKALGSLGGLVLSRRFFPFRCGTATALGFGDDWSIVPGPDNGVSMPGIGTGALGDAPELRVAVESV